MFLGHYGAALAAKRVAPRVSLGALVAAAQLPDLVWPIFVLAGIERIRIAPGDTVITPIAFDHYPWTHSLVAVILWGLAFAAIHYATTRDRAGSLVVGALVVSHWVLDAVVHRPDLPLTPGGETLIGFGLWNSVPATLAAEAIVFLGGLALYASVTRARDRIGSMGLWLLAALLVMIYAGSLLGPPPPTAAAVGWVSLAAWLFPLLAWWIDRHREYAGATHGTVYTDPTGT